MGCERYAGRRQRRPADVHAEVGSLRRSVEAGESRWSKGRDGLRRTGPRQLSFAFADSPQGGGEAGTPDASGGRAFLLHTAKRKRTAPTAASTAETSKPHEDAEAGAAVRLKL